MRWPRRKPVESEKFDHTESARQFWRRWGEMLPEIAAALGDREPHRFEHQLADAVAALHPDLQFAVEAGARAEYALVVSGQEDPRLRDYTDAWKATAPDEDHLWEYHDHVPAVPDPAGVTVNVAGHSVALADILVHAQPDGAATDVAVFHPVFAELSEQNRRNLTFLSLDATLGERTAAKRLGRVETALAEPANAISLGELRTLLAD